MAGHVTYMGIEEKTVVGDMKERSHLYLRVYYDESYRNRMEWHGPDRTGPDWSGSG
jgi:hypothetical protein